MSVRAFAWSDQGASAAVEPSRKPSSTRGAGGSRVSVTVEAGGTGPGALCSGEGAASGTGAATTGADGIAVTAAPRA